MTHLVAERAGNRNRFRVVALAVGLVVAIVAGGVLADLGPGRSPLDSTDKAGAAATDLSTHIKHVIVVTMENRSFDSYFGTYPGADGIPMSNGTPTVCVPDPHSGACVKPFVDHADDNIDGLHDAVASKRDVNGGRMNGFISSMETALPTSPTCADALVEECPDRVMGYHTASDIPNYWAYAQNFVLQDHMYSPVASWSLPAHLYEVSEWSAVCTKHNVPSSCKNSLNQDPSLDQITATKKGGKEIFAWTDMTYLFHKNKVSWGYYVVPGVEADCADDSAYSCIPKPQNAATPGIWNPLANFDTVKNNHQLKNIQPVSSFYQQVKTGTLPSVSWVVPSFDVSEHAPASVSAGQSYVTSLVNAVMSGPDWNSTALFVTWDDWGGFYDHVKPPKVDQNGYGLRVPGLLISPYAKQGYIDHQTLSFDAINKLIELWILNGQALDPKTDGRPDPRPTVREKVKLLGNLLSEFDFTQAPRPPMLLPVHPATTLTTVVPFRPAPGKVSPGNGRARVSWAMPLSDGGFPISNYVVTPILHGVMQTPVTVAAPDQKIFATTIGGLQNGQTYSFAIRAVSAVGSSIDAISGSVSLGPPLRPAAAGATPGKRRAVVRWKPPADNNSAPVTGYIITPYVGSRAANECEARSASPVENDHRTAGRHELPVRGHGGERGGRGPARFTATIRPT